MKFALGLLLFGAAAFAQNVGVSVDKINADENTTIEIRKGNQSSTVNKGAQFEITQGEDSVEGEPAPLLKEARNNWRKACQDWKKELKDLNKENSILSMSCGTQNCTTQSMETVCTSKATYKLRVKIN